MTMAGFLGAPSLATMIGPVAVCTISSVGLDDSSPDLIGFIGVLVSFDFTDFTFFLLSNERWTFATIHANNISLCHTLDGIVRANKGLLLPLRVGHDPSSE